MKRVVFAWMMIFVVFGCGSQSDGDDRQLPPVDGFASIRSWLSAGHYNAWACEPSAHAARSPSPHAMNRICSNEVLSAAGAGEYPVGSASVKELFDEQGSAIVGYAVARHTVAGRGGETWYWYETVPANSPAPHDANGTVADGLGASGPAKEICVGCHQAAGSDADHAGHDMIYTQVRPASP